MADRTLDERVLAELLQLRKQTAGVTVETLAHASLICDLLGAGDPYVAYTRLGHEILDSDLGLPMQAAAASLGFLAEGRTHLERLDAFGLEVGMEQRQVRRYSDRGIRTLARLIATNWPTETVPRLDATVVRVVDGWELHLVTARLLLVEMRTPVVTLLQGASRSRINLRWKTRAESTWEYARTEAPLYVADREDETSVAVVWRGELWPKLCLTWIGAHVDGACETLGNKLVVRLSA
ncbi:hypothetical protein HQQ81_19490 [Microbacteriaceae bacterium VKM Ac-2854]|nr:hypothetical protein [Microbacteriaceae bacterium VKM Ac-2854]